MDNIVELGKKDIVARVTDYNTVTETYGKNIEPVIFGIFLGLAIMLGTWLNTTVVNETTDGKFYIESHGTKYELVSDKPIEIITSTRILNIPKK